MGIPKIDINSPQFKRWEEAREKFSQESRLQRRTLESLPPEEMRSNEQSVIWAIASARYRKAAKEYHRERTLFTSFVREKASKPPDFATLLKPENWTETPELPSINEVREQRAKQEIYANDPRIEEIRKAALARMNHLPSIDEEPEIVMDTDSSSDLGIIGTLKSERKEEQQ